MRAGTSINGLCVRGRAQVVAVVIFVGLFAASATEGALVLYDDDQRVQWFADAASAGMIETITFTEHPIGPLTTQYRSSHGMIETSPGLVQITSIDAFLMDGRGMEAVWSDAALEFDRPMLALAADFPGTFIVEFYSDDVLLGSSFFHGPGGPGNFSGVISTDPFNRVRMWDVDSDLAVDDLHFVALPAPPILLAFAGGLALLARGRRRRGASDMRGGG
jgi:hypothetical protein